MLEVLDVQDAITLLLALAVLALTVALLYVTRPARDGQQVSIRVHRESDHLWAEVAELPGCFASGRTTPELAAALEEAIGLWLSTESCAVVTPVVGNEEPTQELPVIEVDPVWRAFYATAPRRRGWLSRRSR